MKSSTLVISLVAIGLASCAGTDAIRSNGISQASNLTVSVEDFRVLDGEPWRGELDYLNFESDERTVIPVGMKILSIDGRRIGYGVQFPGEEQYNMRDEFRFSSDSSSIGDGTVISKERTASGILQVVTLEDGEDAGQSATIRMTYLISPTTFSLRKDVKYESTDVFFNRNEFSFER